LVTACGSAPSEPAKDATDAAPAASTPADSAAPAADSKPAEKPAAEAAGDDAAWTGESEAKAAAAPAAGGKTETRTMDVIAQVVKENRKPVRECFDKAKKDLPDLKGDMVIHFIVDPEGKVKKADLNQERSTLKSPAVVDCAIKVIFGIKFPASSRGMDTTVNYPFNLN
ncbi:MAG TPA: AgmX/PglI C-terminal domain-containing protein, partial [Polyangiaceae bacterium]|nr:AgmX/PglI C-terminal domain-containing protein [Polyangiaceae bacterium]